MSNWGGQQGGDCTAEVIKIFAFELQLAKSLVPLAALSFPPVLEGDLNFTILPFFYQNDVFWFLLLPDPLLHSCTPYISLVKYRDCHVSCLFIYWILLSLSERSPRASISSCSGSKSVRSPNLKTLFSTLWRCA